MALEKPPQEYLFEPMKLEDLSNCVDVIVKAMGDPNINKDFVKQSIRDPNVVTLIARSREKIVGVIYGFVPYKLYSNQAPKIVFMGVENQEEAMKGLYGMLIDEFINELKRRFPKVPCIDVSLASKDTNAVALYSNRGFSVEGYIRDGVGGPDIVLLRKRFTTSEIEKA
ncbi:MAG: hypothetical protein QG670_1082 [Thermoproteota archaeon]|nr:hypothetical protein [Thermoproteota archaeon]